MPVHNRPDGRLSKRLVSEKVNVYKTNIDQFLHLRIHHFNLGLNWATDSKSICLCFLCRLNMMVAATQFPIPVSSLVNSADDVSH